MSAEAKEIAAAIPAQFLLLRRRNKKQWAKDHFERLSNNEKSHGIIVTE